MSDNIKGQEVSAELLVHQGQTRLMRILIDEDHRMKKCLFVSFIDSLEVDNYQFRCMIAVSTEWWPKCTRDCFPWQDVTGNGFGQSNTVNMVSCYLLTSCSNLMMLLFQVCRPSATICWNQTGRVLTIYFYAEEFNRMLLYILYQ